MVVVEKEGYNIVITGYISHKTVFLVPDPKREFSGVF